MQKRENLMAVRERELIFNKKTNGGNTFISDEIKDRLL